MVQILTIEVGFIVLIGALMLYTVHHYGGAPVTARRLAMAVIVLWMAFWFYRLYTVAPPT